MERKNKTREGKKIEREKKRKRIQNWGGGKNGHLIFLLSMGDKRKF